MKFNPITKKLFSDDGQLIKKVNCPYKMQWDDLSPIDNEINIKRCSICDHNIIDTANLNDVQLLNLVRENPKTCFKINFNQQNLKITTNGNMVRK